MQEKWVTCTKVQEEDGREIFWKVDIFTIFASHSCDVQSGKNSGKICNLLQPTDAIFQAASVFLPISSVAF